MDTKNKKILAGIVALAIVIPGAIWAKSLIGPSVVTCEAGDSCNISIQQAQPVTGEVLGASAPQDFTDLTALRLSGDLQVNGTSTFTGTTTFSGAVSGVPKSVATSMSSSATTTACSLLNTSTVTRTVIEANVVDTGSAASLGSVTWNAGTTTALGVASVNKAVAAAITRLSGLEAITTSSTPQSVYYQWRSGEYFAFVSGTTTNSGTCNIVYL